MDHCSSDKSSYEIISGLSQPNTASRIFESLLHSTSEAVIILDLSKTVLYANHTAEKLFGLSLDELINRPFPYHLVPDERVVIPITRPDGSITYCETQLIKCDEDRIYLVLAKDATSQHLVHNAIDSLPDEIAIIDNEYRILYANKAFENLVCADINDIIGRNLSDIPVDFCFEELKQVLDSGSQWRSEVQLPDTSGNMLSMDMSVSPVNSCTEVRNYVTILRKTSHRHDFEERVNHAAMHDTLTGLPNRLLIKNILEASVERAQKSYCLVGLAIIGIDRFKSVNDSLGQEAGDLLLQSVSERLNSIIAPNDVLARIGGDEFLIIFEDIKDEEELSTAAENLLTIFTQAFKIGERELYITASMGLSMYPNHGKDLHSLLKAASAAMHKAKEAGRNCCRIYSEEITASASEHLVLENGLRRALKRNELFLCYQPCLELTEFKVTGFEALVRWNHPDLGFIPPDRFIPIAEECGLIGQIGEWVLREACMQTVKWQQMGIGRFKASVNISAKQFANKNMISVVRDVLDESGLDPRMLTLELTETALIQNPEATVGMLKQLKQMGIQIAIDDFGIGYSSLNYLKQFPIDALKIDRSFIKDITTNPNDAAIVGAIIAVAHALCLNVIAEGVEIREQLEFLKLLQCNEMQGYLASKPVTADVFPNTIQTLSKWKPPEF